ncbi:MAG: PAC2 family protein [Acidimicrobiales bacterium]
MSESSLYTIVSRPELSEPVLLIVMNGWIDASSAAQAAADVIVSQSEPTRVADFDDDQLLDHRARRPTLRIDDGVSKSLDWPAITLDHMVDNDGTDILLLGGPEPDYHWRSFTAAIDEIIADFGVRMVVSFGAYPAAAPHTRPPALSSTASSPELAHLPGFLNASLDVPAGIQTSIEMSAAVSGLPSIGLWAQVPHYLGGMPYPVASAALLDGLFDAAHIKFDSSELAKAGVTARQRIDELLEQNPDHQSMLADLEKTFDDRVEAASLELPSGDDLAEQFEQFLRNQPET